MKKAFLVLAVVLIAGAAVYAAGCGGGSSDAGGANGDVSEAELGIPIYPGATKVDLSAMRERRGPQGSAPRSGDGQANGSMPQVPGGEENGSAPRFQGSVPDEARGSTPRGMMRQMAADVVVLWTPAETANVTAWYKKELSSKPGFSEDSMPTRFLSEGNGETTRFTFTEGKATRTVMVRNDMRGQGGTTIIAGELPEGFNGGPPTGGPNRSGSQNESQ